MLFIKYNLLHNKNITILGIKPNINILFKLIPKYTSGIHIWNGKIPIFIENAIIVIIDITE